MLDTTFLQQHHHELSGSMRCKYPGKFCRQQRARKRNGQLHRFCEEHRSRANQNQKRWSESRLQRWETMAQYPDDGVSSDTSNSHRSASGLRDPHVPQQEHEILALMQEVQGFGGLYLDAFECPLQFPAIDNTALASLGEPVSADLDGFLLDLLATAAPDAFMCPVPVYGPTWKV